MPQISHHLILSSVPGANGRPRVPGDLPNPGQQQVRELESNECDDDDDDDDDDDGDDGDDGDDDDGDAPVGREGYPWQRAALRRESLCLEFHNKDK